MPIQPRTQDHREPQPSRAERSIRHACVAFVAAVVLAILTVLSLAPAAHAELISQKSAHSFEDTVQRLRDTVQERGFRIFAEIDHAAAAQDVGLEMNPATVVIFGNPKIGTGVMTQIPQMAVVLPIRILVWQDDAGTVQLGFQSLVHEGAGLDLPADHPFLTGATGGMTKLIAAVAG
ncbi:MAG: DUF302 domain-containing protein [Pseudomonadota bacterium]